MTKTINDDAGVAAGENHAAAQPVDIALVDDERSEIVDAPNEIPESAPDVLEDAGASARADRPSWPRATGVRADRDRPPDQEGVAREVGDPRPDVGEAAPAAQPETGPDVGEEDCEDCDSEPAESGDEEEELDLTVNGGDPLPDPSDPEIPEPEIEDGA